MRILFASIGFLIALGIIGSMDRADEELNHKQYCELVAMWEADRAKGINAYDRKGHPNFHKKECK